MEEYEFYQFTKNNTIIIRNKETQELCEIGRNEEINALFGEPSLPLYEEPEHNVGVGDELESIPKILSKNTGSSKVAVWNDAASLKLIELYKEKEMKFRSNIIKNESVWREIQIELKEANFNVTTQQCINKWKHLRKIYMKHVDNRGAKGTGESPIESFKFFEEMDDIFSDKPNVTPVAIASSSKGSQLDPSVTKRQANENEVPPVNTKKIKSGQLVQWLETRDAKREEEKKNRHEERLAVQRETMKMFENLCDILKQSTSK